MGWAAGHYAFINKICSQFLVGLEMSRGQGLTPIGRIGVSLEFFPPKTTAMVTSLWEALQDLLPLDPVFVSVTYGAGGTTRDRTHKLVKDIKRITHVRPAAHLTCVGSSRAEIRDIAQNYFHDGVTHIVALRGDPPERTTKFEPYPGGYGGSVELIEGLREVAEFEITAAAYPEGHPESQGMQSDMEHLKRKCDAGAVRLITQFFYNNDQFFRFYERVRACGITVPIVPGILPITNFEQIARFSATCGSVIPKAISEQFEGVPSGSSEASKVALDIACEQCSGLISQGVEELHFYTLNRSDLILGIWDSLGLKFTSSPSLVGVGS